MSVEYLGNMNEDGLESMSEECLMTSSQERKLKKCRFAVEEDPSSVQVTGIMMVSPPPLEDDVFHTPPEHSRSDYQGPDIPPVITQVLTENGSQAENAVDLGKDSDTFVFSEPSVMNIIDGVKDVVCHPDLSRVEKCKVLESECGESVSNVSAEDMEFTQPIVIQTQDVEIEGTELVRVSENTEKVDQHVEGANSGGHSANKNIEDLDSFECGSVGGAVERGRGKAVPVTVRPELPDSLQEPEENEGLRVFRKLLKDLKPCMDLLEAAGIFTGDTSTDTDYLKAAKEKGLTFDRPRWWPPEGFDDQSMD